MIRKFALSIFIAAACLVATPAASHAMSLKIAPLSYESSLKKGEVKKGFIDVSNPEGIAQDITLQVKAFRQVDDRGSLEFYDAEQLKAGVKLDYEKLTLGPREAYRVYFLLDGNKLPTGDIFGAIFASTKPQGGSGSVQSVQVGTLLIIENGTPGARNAEIRDYNVPTLQLGDGLRGQMTIYNTAKAGEATGYYPKITITPQPYGSFAVKGPLIFAGRSRPVTVTRAGDYFGPVLLKASVGNSEASRWVFAVTGYWRWLAPLIFIIIISLIGIIYRLLHRSAK